MNRTNGTHPTNGTRRIAARTLTKVSLRDEPWCDKVSRDETTQDRWSDRLTRYVEGGELLDAPGKQDVSTHLAKCRNCRNAVASMRQTAGQIG